MSFDKRKKKKRKMNRERERDLVDSSADELAAENNVTEQDGEIAAWLWVLRLLIQHEPCYCHQVRPVCFRRVIHFLPFFSFLSSLPVSLSKHLGARFEVKLRAYIYRYIFQSGGKERGTQERNLSEWGQRRWDEMRWDDGAISYSYLLSTEVSEDTWRAWSEGSERVVITAMRITSFVVFFSWSSLFVLLFPSCNVYLDTPLVTRPSLGRGQLRALRGNLYHTRPDAFFFVRGRSEFLRFSYPSTSNFTDNFSWISI